MSLPHFINKLKEKKQSYQQQNQAFDAVSIFFELEPGKNVKETNPYYEKKPPLTNSSWVSVYNDLKSEIKIRHYSPSTLKTYIGWSRQFQNFTKSKDPQLLVDSDVKNFLTHLAVDRKVAASTQNQAFKELPGRP